MLLTVTGKKMRWQLACICNLARIKKKENRIQGKVSFQFISRALFLKKYLHKSTIAVSQEEN
jgi:hypothetical protein